MSFAFNVFFEQGLKLFVPIADFVGIKMIAQNPSVYACFVRFSISS
jgi:hypothetical protein